MWEEEIGFELRTARYCAMSDTPVAHQTTDSVDSLHYAGTSESSLDATLHSGPQTPASAVASPTQTPSAHRGKSIKVCDSETAAAIHAHAQAHAAHAAAAAAALSLQKRRSSSRSIKRKKFDDELVESSLIKSNRARPPLPSSTQLGMIASTFAPSTLCSETTVPTAFEVQVASLHLERKKTSKSSSKKVKKSKNFQAIVARDLGRWKPTDDLALIIAVQQTNDLSIIHQGVKFSCKFTLKEIQERWYALLYDPVISKMAVSAMKQLHPELIAAVQCKALFSKVEEQLLGQIGSTSQPTIETFQELLSKQYDVFYPSRSAKVLHNHWLLMKQYHLLPDQAVQPMPRGEHVLNFSDAEEIVNNSDLQEPHDEVLEHELACTDRRIKEEIRHLENELPKWQVLVDSVTGISPADFDNQTLAVLRGRLVRYLMRSKEISFGRATKDNTIDVDLSLEGPAWKISRRQGMIKLCNNGEFFILNEGKRGIYIDSKPILAGSKCRLNNNSVVEISGLRFIFLINQDLIHIIRSEAAKMTT